MVRKSFIFGLGEIKMNDLIYKGFERKETKQHRN
jgi:hypothetical protein